MTNADDVREIALSLPGAIESSHFDQPDFRIGKRIFASFPESDRVTVRLAPEHARALVASDPETYIPHAGVWGDRGWIRVVLAFVDRELLADLIVESWYRLANNRLRAVYASQADSARPDHSEDGPGD
jgi:hypothetical protein